jgi:hypothetical protein
MPELSPLANAIYKHLVRTARRVASSPEPGGLTYAELATAVGSHQRSAKLHAALTELTRACRRAHLPCLPAIVWRSGSGRPGDGYYAIAHPRALTDEARRNAWRREHARVCAEVASYPKSLAARAGGAA